LTVIRITKRRVRLRKWLEVSKALLVRKFEWISRKPSPEATYTSSDGVIHIGKGVSKKPLSKHDVHEIPVHDLREAGSSEIRLTVPLDRAKVTMRPLVEGYVADCAAEVWVVVHPMEVSDYWVQPPVTVRQDGAWGVQIYIGRPGMIDVGKHFEVMACANPYVQLWEGLVLGYWPAAEWKSDIVRIVRVQGNN
jgi:hypothetical protein